MAEMGKSGIRSGMSNVRTPSRGASSFTEKGMSDSGDAHIPVPKEQLSAYLRPGDRAPADLEIDLSFPETEGFGVVLGHACSSCVWCLGCGWSIMCACHPYC